MNRQPRTKVLQVALFIALSAMLAASSDAHAQASARGFQLNRYQPTPSGDWFFAVEHPWYSSQRWFAGGFTLDYAHNPEVIRRNIDGNRDVTYLIRHQVTGHFDLSASFLDRIGVSVALPLKIYEGGRTAFGVGPSGFAAGDPRLGLRVRLFNQPDRDPISVSLGLYVWIPVGNNGRLAGDGTLRVMPRLLAGGVVANRLRWSFNLGYQVRSEAILSSLLPPGGTSTGPELSLGWGFGITNKNRTFSVGPEIVVSTIVGDGRAFMRNYTTVETLVSGQYLFHKVFQLGAAIGPGFERQAGTPDVRFLVRLAYAPLRPPPPPPDADRDGIPDSVDACPNQAGSPSPDRARHGCPADRDGDGVLDRDDACPDQPAGARPDPMRPGCPLVDRDGDGVPDYADLCPDQPAGPHPNPERAGCPDGDRDGDGVLDHDDRCPDQAAGPHPDPERAGCPDGDRDHDGIVDHEDQCPDLSAGLNPDPQKAGCPAPDRDKDSVPDKTDACPDRPGAPSPDPKRNGCPGLLALRGSSLAIFEQVHFATGKDTILGKSTPILQAIADALTAQPGIKRMAVEGHTDDRGSAALNHDLSARRAQSVVRWLVAHGIAAERLEAHGYGPSRPIASNKTEEGRAKNRRVELHIIDPPPSAIDAPHAP